MWGAALLLSTLAARSSTGGRCASASDLSARVEALRSGAGAAVRITAFLIVALAALAGHARAAVPSLRATRIKGDPPRLDGRLDDPAWRQAVATDAFTQKFPDEGEPPVERTELRVLYDDDAIWVGFTCTQREAPVVARLTRRDRVVDADRVTVALDSRRSGTGAFEFTVNAAGVLQDSLRFDDTASSSDWDENWDARVARTVDGWSAEIRIPLRVLRFDEAPVAEWGLQARRYVSVRHETDEWSYIPRDVAGEVSHYGRLVELVGLHPGGSVELRPFVLGRLRHRDAVADYLASGWDATASAGLDAKWHITQNLTLDATVNPDFAQVEADQIVLNLTTYETFYPEKRPFFLEGIDTFASPLQLLYTRRIGLYPGIPALAGGEQLVDQPDPTRIYGAAKLVGTIGPLTVAALTAVTARNDVAIQTPDGKQAARLADPLSLWNVLRLKLAVGDNAHVGLLATGVTRFEPTGDYPATDGGAFCPTGDVVVRGARCLHDAYVGGLDARWRSPGGDYVAQGQVIESQIVGGPPRLFPDGTVVRDGDRDLGAFFYLAKEGGKHWQWELEWDGSGRRLDYKDAGYMPRQNLLHLSTALGYRTLEPWWHTLETHTRFELYDRTNLDGLNLARGYQLNTTWKWSSFWETFVEVHYRADHLDDREVGDGTALERGGLVGLEIGMTSDPRRRVTGELWTQTQLIRWPGNGLYLEADARLTVRALPQLDFDLLPTVVYAAGEPRWTGLATDAGVPLFGNLTATSIGTTLRATYTFAPRLTFQLYAQLFLVAKHYDAFTAPRGSTGHGAIVRLAELDPTPMPSLNPDGEEGLLNVSAVLRWEYRLGSVLHVVYTRAQAPNLALVRGQQATLDIGAVRAAPAADAFVIKLAYWWG